MVGGDWDSVRNAIDDVKLFNRDLIDLVQNVDTWDVNPVVNRDLINLSQNVDTMRAQ